MKTLISLIVAGASLLGVSCDTCDPRGVLKQVVRTTAYTHTEADHWRYGRKTAIGTVLSYGNLRSAAADWSVYPVGTRFRIGEEPHVYVVEDYGSALVGTSTIDIYKPSKQAMHQWGVRHVWITIIEWGSPSESLRILGPRCRNRHCRTMYNNLLARSRRPMVFDGDET